LNLPNSQVFFYQEIFSFYNLDKKGVIMKCKKIIRSVLCAAIVCCSFSHYTHAKNIEALVNAIKRVRFHKTDLAMIFGGPVAAAITHEIKKNYEGRYVDENDIIGKYIGKTSGLVTLTFLSFTFVYLAKILIGGFNSFVENKK